jgi:hypothetical protein
MNSFWLLALGSWLFRLQSQACYPERVLGAKDDTFSV